MKIVGYRLQNEDLTELGGPMGSERVSIRWARNFETVSAAKAAAEKDYGSHTKSMARDSQLKWTVERDGLRSDDLGWVMYHITPIKIEY